MIQITSGNVCVTKSTFLKTAHKDKKTKDFFIWLFARGRGRGFLTDSSLGSCFTMFFNREMVGFLAVRRMSSTILSPRSSRPLARIPTLITPFSSRDELSVLLETREKKRKKKIKDKRFTIKVCMKSTLRSSNTFNFFFFFYPLSSPSAASLAAAVFSSSRESDTNFSALSVWETIFCTACSSSSTG